MSQIPVARLPQPQNVAVVGAGIVGLSTAWHLRRQGAEVTVLEQRHVAAGSSWGNAGWLTPSLATPLPEPPVLAYGLRAVFNPSSPIYVPPAADWQLLRFMFGFVRASTYRRWGLAVRAYLPLNRAALDAFDELVDAGVRLPMVDSPLLACFRTASDRQGLVDEINRMQVAGQEVDFDLLTGAEARELEPLLSDGVGAAVRFHRQRYIDPPAFMEALADAVRKEGAEIREGVGVTGIDDQGTGVALTLSGGQIERFDAVVVATGAHMPALVRRFGVRMPVQAGRGYSFEVSTEQPPQGPIYFPTQRVALTPLGNGLRVAGMMEMRRPDAPIDPRRIKAIVEAARPLLRGTDLDDRRDVWVGSRPLTPDGMPLIGRTQSPRVLVAGGHGMWGVVLGPITGRLVAQTVCTGRTPPELTPFDPLR